MSLRHGGAVHFLCCEIAWNYIILEETRQTGYNFWDYNFIVVHIVQINEGRAQGTQFPSPLLSCPE